MKKPRTKEAAHSAHEIKGLYLRGDVWWFRWSQNGTQRRTSLHTTNYVEAVALAARISASPHFQSGTRILDELEKFQTWKAGGGHHARHTKEWAASPIKQLATFLGNPNVDAVRREDLERFWNELRGRLAETSAASYMRAVQSFFSWLLGRQKIVGSPLAGLVMPKVTRAARVRFCDTALRDRLIKEAPTWDLKYVLLSGCHGGMRKNEQIEARPEWFDLERGFFTVQRTATFRPKDRDLRTVPMTDAFLAFMRKAAKDGRLGGPFVLRPEVKHGRSAFRYDYRVPFEAYREKQECEWVGPHTLRHTFGALYISDGGSLFRLAQYLGDTIEVTEKHYAHLVPDRDDIQRGHGKVRTSRSA